MSPSPVTIARHAMATRFELVLHGHDPVSLRAAGEEALDEVDRLENRLSLHRPGSEIAQINARAARGPVRVTPDVFALLHQAQSLHTETYGAFDITIAPLVRCWGFMGASGKMPSPEEVARARECVGMHHVHLDPQAGTVQFAREGVMLGLGAIGKGYAVGQAAEILRAAGVDSALIHGGTSTVYAIGHPPDDDAWTVAIEPPPPGVPLAGSPPRPLAVLPAQLETIRLCHEAMSVSAIWGRSFLADGKLLGHVLDPRTGHPVDHALLAAVILPSATETDALSTALLVLGTEGRDSISRLRSAMKTLVLTQIAGGLRLDSDGITGHANRARSPVKRGLDQNAR